MRFSMLALLCFSASAAFAQHNHTPSKPAVSKEPLSFETVRNEWLTDPDLKGYKLESSVLTIAPGAQDTVSHRHDCDLFGYVLEGEVQIGLDHKAPELFKTGQMFFEKRNIIHSLAANNLKDKPSRVLLLFLIKDGRSGYTPEYPEKTPKK
nr:cupin domain-containing protein [uncultured Dyadobacter sp.]